MSVFLGGFVYIPILGSNVLLCKIYNRVSHYQEKGEKLILTTLTRRKNGCDWVIWALLQEMLQCDVQLERTLRSALMGPSKGSSVWQPHFRAHSKTWTLLSGVGGGNEGGRGKAGAKLFQDFQMLSRIWTHPWCLQLDYISKENKVN